MKDKIKLKHMRGFYGVKTVPAVCVLPKSHPCYKCVWYARDTNVLYCPFQECVKNKKIGGDKNVD